MERTNLLSLPYIMAAQAQKHITHNEALRALDAIVQIGVQSRNAVTPPSEPLEGERHILGLGTTGDWTGHDEELAAFQDGAWAFFQPQPGWLAWLVDEELLLAFDGAAWVETAPDINSAAMVGVNATADTSNRLAIKSDGILLSHDDVTPGSGDVRLVLNKSAASGTASLVFQNGYSGRAEFGLTGDDHWRVKVSPDGVSWVDAISIDDASGFVGIGTTAPLGPLHVSGDDAGLVLENIQDPGQVWSIAPGRSGIYDNHLIISAAVDINDPSKHQVRFPLDGAPVFVNGAGVADGSGFNSETNFALAHYKPFDGSRGSLAFRGAGPVADFQIFGWYNEGGWHQSSVACFQSDSSGVRMGIGNHNPSTALHVEGPARLGSFTVAAVPDAADTGAGSIIYVADETGGSVLAFSDGTDWRRVTDRAVIS